MGMSRSEPAGRGGGPSLWDQCCRHPDTTHLRAPKALEPDQPPRPGDDNPGGHSLFQLSNSPRQNLSGAWAFRCQDKGRPASLETGGPEQGCQVPWGRHQLTAEGPTWHQQEEVRATSTG